MLSPQAGSQAATPRAEAAGSVTRHGGYWPFKMLNPVPSLAVLCCFLASARPAIQVVVSLGRGGGAGALREVLAALTACAARNCFGPEGHCWAAGTRADSFLSLKKLLVNILPTLPLPPASDEPDKGKACTVLAWLAPTAQGKPPFSCCFRILLPINTCTAMADKHLMQAIAVM